MFKAITLPFEGDESQSAPVSVSVDSVDSVTPVAAMAMAAVRRRRRLPKDVTVIRNSVCGKTLVGICMPTYRDNPVGLIAALAALPGADQFSLQVYDDGSQDAALTEAIAAAIQNFPGPATLLSAQRNRGRAKARNLLQGNARSPWLLLLDADMLPDSPDFLNCYLEAIVRDPAPALLAGGYSVVQAVTTPKTALHAAQSARSCCLSAAERSRQPGRYVLTSNILVHRRILEEIPFDPEFVGWGWEDVDWGLRVVERYPVRHLDNLVSHLGLEQDSVLLSRYATSAANFARVLARHPEAAKQMPLYRVVKRLGPIPAKGLIAWAAAQLVIWVPGLMPMAIRLFAAKLYRAVKYAQYLESTPNPLKTPTPQP